MYDRVKRILKEMKADAILVADGYNMRYLSGFRGATGYLYISKQRRVLMTDSRYTTQARMEAPEYEIVESSVNHGYAAIIGELLAAEKVAALGFEDLYMIYSDVKELQEKCGDVNWLPIGERLNELRIVKTTEELEKLAKAEATGDLAFEYILGEIEPGMTELQIAAKLEYKMKELGAQGNSFESIVASGPNSALPHAMPSERKVEKGDFLTMDFGCLWDGYCSDMTRTIVVGKVSDKQKEIYNVVLEAQLAALDVIKAGLTGVQVDKVARDIIATAGYGEYFGHGLGHSVGLFIHEEPRLSPKCNAVLQENVIATVEPGIYIPEFGGVRIEDMVVITKDGHRNFTSSKKELIEL